MNNQKNGVPVWYRWLPFLQWWHLVNRNTLRADFFAGLTGAVIVLPQGVAYALIAGLPPEYGLYTAIVTPIIAGLFGCSLHLVSGPTAAISIVVFSVISSFAQAGTEVFVSLVLTLTLLTGLIQLFLGFARLGALVNFISHTVVIGFTAGAAVFIAVSQLKHLFGLDIAAGGSLYERVASVVSLLHEVNPYALVIGALTIALSLFIKFFFPRLPHMLLAMIGASFVCWFIDGGEKGVALVGALPGTLPPLVMPDLSPDTIRNLMPGAFAVAMLALIEAVSIARAVAIRSQQRIDGNQEFVGQGLSNMVGSFFSCYAGSGSFTRTGANYDAGAKTPISGIIAAVTLILIIVFLPDITQFLPMAAMAGTILLIAWNLVDWHHITHICAVSRKEAITFVVTFLATLLIDLEFAIYAGILISLFLYLQQTSKPTIEEVPKDLLYPSDYPKPAQENLDKILLIRINGSLFFGAVDHVKAELEKCSEAPGVKHLVVICAGVNFIDLAGAEMLVNVLKTLEEKGIKVHLTRLKTAPKKFLEEGGYSDQVNLKMCIDNPADLVNQLCSHTNTATS